MTRGVWHLFANVVIQRVLCQHCWPTYPTSLMVRTRKEALVYHCTVCRQQDMLQVWWEGTYCNRLPVEQDECLSGWRREDTLVTKCRVCSESKQEDKQVYTCYAWSLQERLIATSFDFMCWIKFWVGETFTVHIIAQISLCRPNVYPRDQTWLYCDDVRLRWQKQQLWRNYFVELIVWLKSI